MHSDILLAALDQSDKGYASFRYNLKNPDEPSIEMMTSTSSFRKLGCLANSEDLAPGLSAILKDYLGTDRQASIKREVYCEQSSRWLHMEILPAQDQYLLVIVSDITDEIDHRHRSQQYQYQYKMIFENSQLGIFRYDQFGVIMETNDAFVEILGSSRDKIVGLKTTTLPDDRMREAIKNTLLGKRERVMGKYRAVTSGKEVDVNCFFSPIVFNDTVIGGFGIVRDITERLRIQRELEDNEANLNYAQHLAGMGSWEATFDGKQLHWSENYYRLLGIPPFSTPPDDALFFQRVHPDDVALFAIDKEEVERNPETIEFEFRIIMPDGELKWMKNSIDPVLENGRLVRLKGINIDITELKEVQLQLEKSLHEKETLLSEVHHRVKNNLAIISSLLHMQVDLDETGVVNQPLLDSISRVRSMALIHELVYRQEAFSELRFDEFLYQFTAIVNDSFSGAVSSVQTRLNTEEIQLHIDKAIPLSLIANELLTNAYKHAFVGRPEGIVSVELYRDDGIHLVIEDNGVGFSQDDSRGEQTLGTSLIYGLVDQLDGNVVFEPAAGGGTRVSVCIQAG